MHIDFIGRSVLRKRGGSRGLFDFLLHGSIDLPGGQPFFDGGGFVYGDAQFRCFFAKAVVYFRNAFGVFQQRGNFLSAFAQGIQIRTEHLDGNGIARHRGKVRPLGIDGDFRLDGGGLLAKLFGNFRGAGGAIVF